jgi:hypothetical protein
MTFDFSMVEGGEVLAAAFGGWPSFHDAEVLQVELDRRGPDMLLGLYTFRAGPGVDERGAYAKSNELRVDFRFRSISELHIEEFNEQNVLAYIHFERDESLIRVELQGLYGLSGRLLCEGIQVIRVEQLAPEGG